jgi:hypothetical protein
MSIAMVSSPTSTSGAGTLFEQHVSAYWLAQLLVRGIPPILIESTVTEVQFQTERLGWISGERKAKSGLQCHPFDNRAGAQR